MTVPELKVEFAFGSTWTDDPAGFTWSDVTTYVESVSTTRGRSFELERFSAGTCQLRLINDDRRFDPLNASGSYYGDLLPGVPVRVRADDGTTVHPLFYGYVDGWKSSTGTHASRTTVPCTDLFKKLANVVLPGVYEDAVLADAPWGYWPLSGTDGDLAADMSGNQRHGTYVGTAIERGASGLRPFSSGITMSGDTASYVRWAAMPNLVDTLGSNWAVEFWCQNPDSVILWQAPGVAISIDNTDGFMAIRWGGTTNYLTVNPSTYDMTDPLATNLRDGRVHHVAILGVPFFGVVLLIDGEVRTVWTDSGPTLTGSTAFSISYPNGSASTALVGTVSDLALYDDSPALNGFRDHYDAGRAPWSGDRTGDRAGRVLGAAAVPDALTNLDTGEVACGNADTAGVTALEYMHILADTEGGRCFIDAGGKVTFHDNPKTSKGPSLYTFSDDGSGAGIVDGSLSFSLDDTFTYDAAVVQKKYGVAQTAGTVTGGRTYTRTGLAHADDRRARATAEGIVARYKTPQTRAESWTVFPDRAPDSWPDILGLELGDVVTLDVTPQGAGDPVEITLFIEQLRWSIDAAGFRWRLELYGSPTDNRNLFTWGGDGATEGWGKGVWR